MKISKSLALPRKQIWRLEWDCHLLIINYCYCYFQEQLIQEWGEDWLELNMSPWPPLPKWWFKNRQWAREFSRLTFSRGWEKLLQCPLAKYTCFSVYGWQWSRGRLFRRKRGWNNHAAQPPETGGGGELMVGHRQCFSDFIFFLFFWKGEDFLRKLSSCQKTKVA